MIVLNGKLSVVIPAYNEEKLIYENLLQTCTILAGFVSEFEVIVVNDGSQDRTGEEMRRASEEDNRIHCLTHAKNQGKGGAIITGVKACTGQYIAFVDADLELNPSQLEGFFNKMLATGKDAVIGCKFHKDSELEYPWKRKVMSMGYYLMLLVLFHLNVKDTQTGLKLFRAEALKPVAELIQTTGFAYDIEILTAIHRRGFTITEMPVKVVYIRESGAKRIGFRHVVRAFCDTWAIFYRVYFKRCYDIR